MATDVIPTTVQAKARAVPAAYGEGGGPGASTFLAQLFAPQRLGLLLVMAAAVAIGIGTWLWARTPDYRVLYANVSDRDGGAIVNALTQMNIPYKFSEGGGAILVPDSQVHDARLRLAGQGLPKGGLVGFELMENTRLGASQFLEQINYQRALEGELARSIQSLAAVDAARVHLAISKPSVFVREQQKPSASVLVNLHPGRTLDQAQVNAIVHLVSSSVPELPVKNVTVVDQSGALLSAEGQAAPVGLDANQLKYVNELEAGHTRRIEAILAPIVGAGNVRAQVTADVDFSQTERAEETFRPNKDSPETAIRSQQTNESATAGASGVGGVPGALSNQPAPPATAPIDAANPAAAGATAVADKNGAPMNTHKEATINYEVDRTVRHVRQSMGAVRRLSAAVVVNHRSEKDAAGKVTTKPLTPEEMTQLTNLVKEAMGFSSERGDTVNVANAPFTTPEKEVLEETPLWKQPGTLALAKDIGRYLLAIGVLIYLVFGVLKPMIRKAAAAASAPPQHAALGAPQGGPLPYEQSLDQARQLARDEPQRVAAVVKQWVGGNE